MKDWRDRDDDAAEQRAWFEFVPLLASWIVSFALTVRWIASLVN